MEEETLFYIQAHDHVVEAVDEEFSLNILDANKRSLILVEQVLGYAAYIEEEIYIFVSHNPHDNLGSKVVALEGFEV